MILLASFALAEVPGIRDPVTDLSEVLTPAEEAVLDGRIRAIREKTGVHVALLTTGLVPFDETIESFSLQVAEQWGGGDSDRDDGILVLFATTSRLSRVEVGYGLEGYVTDAEAGELLEAAVPALREQDWVGAFGGVIDGIGAEVDSLVAGEPPPVHRRALGAVLRVIPRGSRLVGFQGVVGALATLFLLMAFVRGEPRGLTARFPPGWLAILAVAAFLTGELAALSFVLAGQAGALFGGLAYGGFIVLPAAWAENTTKFFFALGAVGAAIVLGVMLDEAFHEVGAWLGSGMMGIFATAFMALEGGFASEGGGGGSGGYSSSSSSTNSSSSHGSSSSSSSGSSGSSGGSSGGDWGGGGGGFGGGGASGSW